MSIWVVVAAIASIVVTALLTLLLWRLNAPSRPAQSDGGEAAWLAAATAGGRDGDRGDDANDTAADSGGADGGGD